MRLHNSLNRFIDNSVDGADFKTFCTLFKWKKGRKKWINCVKDVPQWFIKYYSEKIPV